MLFIQIFYFCIHENIQTVDGFLRKEPKGEIRTPNPEELMNLFVASFPRPWQPDTV